MRTIADIHAGASFKQGYVTITAWSRWESILGELGIGQLAQQHARWLMVRQNAIANNIANSSSPGYRATDTRPFVELLERTDLAMSMSSPAHMQSAEQGARQSGTASVKPVDVSHSGNTVSLDRQMVMANEVRQGYALNTSIVKSFHRLLLSAAK